MRLPLILLLLCSLLASCATTSRQPEATAPPAQAAPAERGSIFTRWIPRLPKFPKLSLPKVSFPKFKFPKFGGGDREQHRTRTAYGRVDVEMAVQPLPLRLSEVRRMVVTIKLINRGKRLIQLQFPNSQRIEVYVLDEKGSRVVQWSEDQFFEGGPSYLSINPGERVQYDLKVATRDLVAGRTYTLEAFVPGYEGLKGRFTLAPQP